jgi:hypothetical protein
LRPISNKSKYDFLLVDDWLQFNCWSLIDQLTQLHSFTAINTHSTKPTGNDLEKFVDIDKSRQALISLKACFETVNIDVAFLLPSFQN